MEFWVIFGHRKIIGLPPIVMTAPLQSGGPITSISVTRFISRHKFLTILKPTSSFLTHAEWKLKRCFEHKNLPNKKWKFYRFSSRFCFLKFQTRYSTNNAYAGFFLDCHPRFRWQAGLSKCVDTWISRGKWTIFDSTDFWAQNINSAFIQRAWNDGTNFNIVKNLCRKKNRVTLIEVYRSTTLKSFKNEIFWNEDKFVVLTSCSHERFRNVKKRNAKFLLMKTLFWLAHPYRWNFCTA